MSRFPASVFRRPVFRLWGPLPSDTSRPFDRPKSGKVAVEVINHLGDEVMKVFRV